MPPPRASSSPASTDPAEVDGVRRGVVTEPFASRFARLHWIASLAGCLAGLTIALSGCRANATTINIATTPQDALRILGLSPAQVLFAGYVDGEGSGNFRHQTITTNIARTYGQERQNLLASGWTNVQVNSAGVLAQKGETSISVEHLSEYLDAARLTNNAKNPSGEWLVFTGSV